MHVAIPVLTAVKPSEVFPLVSSLVHPCTVCLSVSHHSPHKHTQHSRPCVLTSHGETLAAPAAGLSVTRSLSLKCPNVQNAAYTSTILGCSNAKQSIGMIQKLKIA